MYMSYAGTFCILPLSRVSFIILKLKSARFSWILVLITAYVKIDV